jgi:predicted CoA-binding protein
MASLQELVQDFLSQRRIAVAGVSRGSGQAANAVYKKLKGSGYQVFGVNPNADAVEGDPCYPDLKSIPGGVDGVVVATHPDVTERIVRECAELGIRRVWIHRSFGTGSVSEAAVQACRERGLSVIAGGCPLMFCEPVDFGHRCMRWVLGWTGGLPK